MKSDKNLIYKYTSTDNLLSKYNALEKQEIYFATLSELNDPFEGVVNTVYNGESREWKYFFELYIQEMINKYMYTYHEKLNYSSFLADKIKSDLLNKAPFLNFYNKINSSVWATKRDVINLLTVLTPWIMNTVSYHMNLYFGGNDKEDISNYNYVNETYIRLLGSFSIYSILRLRENDIFYDLIKNLLDIVNNIKFNNNNLRVASRFYDSPDKFIRYIEAQYIPSCRLASFSGNYDNMSMWGHYADSHKGVCLCFNVINDKCNINKKTESIGTIKFYNCDGLDTLLYKVNYVKNYIDFMGDGIKVLYMFYFQQYLSDISKSDRECEIKKMNEFIHNSYTRKTTDWEYENEYRIILPNNGYKTKLRYDFSALDSIIFGVNTPFEKRKQIIDIIESKCKMNNRKEFKFYQVDFGRSILANDWKNNPVYKI